MNIYFKRSYVLAVLLGATLWSISSCKEEELVFPPQTDQEVVVTETRPTARPTNLTYVSAFNQNVEVHWPALSDRVSKAQIKYKEGAEEKLVEVKKFDEPTLIHLVALKSYDFTVQYFTADGTPSKVTKTALTPRPYEVDYKLDNAEIKAVPGGISIIMPQTSTREISGKLSYTYLGKSFVLDIKGNTKDTVLVSGLDDETKNVTFSVKLEDDKWTRTATLEPQQLLPGMLIYKLVLPTVIPYMEGNDVVLTWANESEEPISIKAQYELNGMKKEALLAENTDADGKLSFDVGGKATAVSYTIASEGGVSAVQNIQVKPLELMDKTVWSAEVSSTEQWEGEANGKAISLIDGDINTYWHSTWSDGEPDYPHWFIIDFAKVELFARFGMIRRHNNSTGGFKTFNVEVSLDKVNWKSVGNDWSFNSADKLAAWQEYGVNATSPKPIKARYVRITMTAPMNSAKSTHLAEFRAFGY